ncbi:MAG: hypothetical protein Q3994_02055 [Prevotella sp.]|nr:hypothetical protein [Prevotella sp.]
MLETLIFAVLIIAVAVFLLSARIVLRRKGEFPNIHIEGSQAMRERDIHCAVEEDAIMRRKMSRRIKE